MLIICCCPSLAALASLFRWTNHQHEGDMAKGTSGICVTLPFCAAYDNLQHRLFTGQARCTVQPWSMWACSCNMLLQRCDSQSGASKARCSKRHKELSPKTRCCQSSGQRQTLLQKQGRASDLDVSQSIGKAGCASEADQHFSAAPRQQHLHIRKSC